MAAAGGGLTRCAHGPKAAQVPQAQQGRQHQQARHSQHKGPANKPDCSGTWGREGREGERRSCSAQPGAARAAQRGRARCPGCIVPCVNALPLPSLCVHLRNHGDGSGPASPAKLINPAMPPCPTPAPPLLSLPPQPSACPLGGRSLHALCACPRAHPRGRGCPADW